jgi:hypothetical protein
MVSGRGFEAGAYQIVLDGAGFGEAVTSNFTVFGTGNEAGQINIAFSLPSGVEGAHIVDVVKGADPTKSVFYGAGYFTTGASLRSGVTSLYPFPTDSEFPRVTINPSVQSTPTTATVGTPVTVTGKGLQPSTTYYVWYDPKGTSTSQAVLMTTTPATVTTDSKGSLTASFVIPQSSNGTRNIWVSTSSTFVNNDPVLGSTVFTEISISAAISTKITLSLTPEIVTQGESVAINGVIEPAISINITLFIKRPDGTTENKTVTSTSSGTFTFSFTPDTAGTWQVTAKWDGNATYTAYTSLAATVTAKPIDMSWAYALTGLGIGIAALALGLIITLYYFMRRRRAAAAEKATAPTTPTTPTAATETTTK